jgi:DNA-binding transcriptional LysR family regulator
MTLDGRLVGNIGVLAAIIEGGSFARAADALGLSPSGVSRAIARLEARIGVRLLDRTTRSVSLTDEGRRLYAEIGPLLTGIEDAVTVTAGAAAVVRGRLRVNVDGFFSRFMLAPHIGRFLQRYPEISLDLNAREQLGDLVAEGFDLALRFGEPPPSSLVARKLLETRTVTVAAPAYIEKHGRPATPADLASHACIQVRNFTDRATPRMEVLPRRQGRAGEDIRAAAGHRGRHLARRLPFRCRHRADQGDRRTGADRPGAVGRTLAGVAGRKLSPLRALSVASSAGSEGEGLHRLRRRTDRRRQQNGERGARLSPPAAIARLASFPNRHAGRNSLR